MAGATMPTHWNAETSGPELVADSKSAPGVGEPKEVQVAVPLPDTLQPDASRSKFGFCSRFCAETGSAATDTAATINQQHDPRTSNSFDKVSYIFALGFLK